MSWFWWLVIIIIGIIILYYVFTTDIARRVYKQAVDIAYKKYGPQPDELPVENNNNSNTQITDQSDARLGNKQTSTYKGVTSVNNKDVCEYVEHEWDDISKSMSRYKSVSYVNGQLPELIEDVNNSGVQWKNQEICCRIMEMFTGEKFIRNAKPAFLKNPETGRNLEVDCYNERLGGLEYNGIQHYVFPNRYHKTEKDFINYTRKDKFKVKQFERVGKNLIVVPYTIKRKDFADFISSQLPDDDEFIRN